MNDFLLGVIETGIALAQNIYLCRKKLKEWSDTWNISVFYPCYCDTIRCSILYTRVQGPVLT